MARPTSCVRRIQSAISSMRRSGASVERPWPGRSGVARWYAPAKASRCRTHSSPDEPAAWRKTIRFIRATASCEPPRELRRDAGRPPARAVDDHLRRFGLRADGAVGLRDEVAERPRAVPDVAELHADVELVRIAQRREVADRCARDGEVETVVEEV